MQLRRVVAGIDFSEASLAAARWVSTHLAPEAELLLVHVVPEPRLPSYMRLQLPPIAEVLACAIPALQQGLARIARQLRTTRTQVEVVTGSPPVALAAAAEQFGADLLCTGRGPRRRWSARFGATTAHRLLARSGASVLVVPPGRTAPPSPVVAALDDREGSDAVARAAASIAAAWDAPLHAVHVIERDVLEFAQAASRTASLHAARGSFTPDECVGAVAVGALDLVRTELLAREWTVRQLERAGARPHATGVVRTGDPGREIVAHAWRTGAGLLVLGRGGEGARPGAPDGALPVGSTTRLALWAAQCPVLVLPAEVRHQPFPERWSPGKARRRGHAGPRVIQPAGATSTGPDDHPDDLPPAARRGDGEDDAA